MVKKRRRRAQGFAGLFALACVLLGLAASVDARAQGACGRALLMDAGPAKTLEEARRREELRLACERERNSGSDMRSAARGRLAARGAWEEAPAAFRQCMEGQLARFATSMESLIQQDVFLGDPYLSELEAYCRGR
jgi:hypothetical protein